MKKKERRKIKEFIDSEEWQNEEYSVKKDFAMRMFQKMKYTERKKDVVFAIRSLLKK